MTSEHVLVISDLSKTYPNGVQALKNVSLTIPTGMFGLLGPNGAGKSTLMRTIATLQEPAEGTIALGELDVLRRKDEVRKILGYLPQEFGVICSRMAVISKGEVLLTGEPSKAIAEVHGRIWRRVVPREELSSFEQKHRVISTHLWGGKTVIHVLDDENPGKAFTPVNASLEDVYFSTLH